MTYRRGVNITGHQLSRRSDLESLREELAPRPGFMESLGLYRSRQARARRRRLERVRAECIAGAVAANLED